GDAALTGQGRREPAPAGFRVSELPCPSRAGPPPGGHIVLRQNLARRQVVDLSALIRTQSQLDDPSPAPPASTPPLPVRRPPPARPRELGLAPPARRLQANGDPTAIMQN